MFKIIIYALLFAIFGKVYCGQKDGTLPHKKNFIYDTYDYDKRIKVYVNNYTEQILDFNENSDLWKGYPTRVHMSTNDTIGSDYPLLVTATQQKGVSSWELPLLVKNDRWALLFNNMGRTLCPHDAGTDIKTENRPTIHIMTSNPNNVSVDIKLRRVTDFYVEVNKETHLNVTPSTPKYYFFSFDQNPWNITEHLQGIPIFNYTIPKSVIVIIESDDDVCATVSIQNNSCPVFDNEKEMLYQGYHLTMTTKGGITLTQSMFPAGFYVAFIVKESDDDCTGANEASGMLGERALWIDERMKQFRFRVVATISYREYVEGALVTVAVVAMVAAVVLVALLPCRVACTEVVTIVEEEPGPSTSTLGPRLEDDVGADDTERTPIVTDHNVEAEDSWSRPQALTVGKLSQAPPDTLARRSDRYFWGALTVAVVYALPVVQLLFTYQQMVFQTGNQDLCYYNFLCAHPLGFLSDFNHVYSNIGYVILGLVFMAQVRARQRASLQRVQDMGIPQHYGLLYSMGLALIMEGLLSACYHLCPNKMNFQFDSSFMYVIAVLLMIKLYQNRHSDLIPSAHSTFMLLSLIMSMGLFGILFPSVYFSVFFTILHLITCFVLTLKIYYAGKFKMERETARRAWAGVAARGARALRPAHTARAVLLALANLANWTFALYTAYEHNKDFARQLLAILMGNAILYTWFYIAMKLVHREKILLHTWLYFVLAHVAWLTALTFFLHANTHWSETPAMSRRHNAVCTSLQFYDSHDLWHVTSAAAMFFSFNMLLTIDDALRSTPRDLLPTF